MWNKLFKSLHRYLLNIWDYCSIWFNHPSADLCFSFMNLPIRDDLGSNSSSPSLYHITLHFFFLAMITKYVLFVLLRPLTLLMACCYYVRTENRRRNVVFFFDVFSYSFHWQGVDQIYVFSEVSNRQVPFSYFWFYGFYKRHIGSKWMDRMAQQLRYWSKTMESWVNQFHVLFFQLSNFKVGNNIFESYK